MINARRRVVGALVAVVIAAGVVAGLGVARDGVGAANSAIAGERALTTDAVLGADIVRGDKHEARRLWVEHFGLALAALAIVLVAFAVYLGSHDAVLDASPAPGRKLGRAPPVSL